MMTKMMMMSITLPADGNHIHYSKFKIQKSKFKIQKIKKNKKIKK
jgi:hypothetical protein